MTLFKIALIPSAILVLHAIATILGWYETYYWFDTPMHFLGGISIGVASFYLLGLAGLESKKFHPKLMQILLIISITALAAVAWEVLEFNLDFVLKTNMQPGMADTMKDLCMGLLGGTLIAIPLILKKKTAH